MKTNMKHEKKVKLLKDAIDVSGEKLLGKSVADTIIDKQIDLLLNATIFSNDAFVTFDSAFIKTAKNKIFTSEEFIKLYDEMMLGILGIDEYLNSKFWRNFSSAPYYQDSEDKKKKGGVGMDTIFGDKFQKNHSNLISIPDRRDNLLRVYNLWVEKENQPIITTKSKYNSIKDIENEFKQIEVEALLFTKDKSKSLKDRVEVFNKFGGDGGCMHEPDNEDLSMIFRQYNEMEYASRREVIICKDVLDWWIDELSEHKCEITHINKYHPKVERTKRNYKPSKEAIERLYNYYMEILIQEGISKFDFDW
tara:strand:+ start:1052 stop:1972 length:921 start_codon:yes stop_codon:yes gene_type:complete